MNIKFTNEIIDAFADCNYKCFLKSRNRRGIKSEYEIIESELLKNYRNNFYNSVCLNDHVNEDSNLKMLCEDTTNYNISPVFEGEEYQIYFDATERNSSSGITPISVSSKERITVKEKIALSLKCFIISELGSINIDHAKIYYGVDLQTLKIKVSTDKKRLKKLLDELFLLLQNSQPPQFYRNDHCSICLFQEECKANWIEKDHLSLLGGMNKNEILKRNNRGIFSILQLSHVFRPKKYRKPKGKSKIYYPELKALALREKKIYIWELPEISIAPIEIYFDIEGFEDGSFYYLIGVIVKQGEIEESFSFWANSRQEEITIFQQFFDLLGKYNDFLLFHYGSYELKAIRKTNKRLNNLFDKEIIKVEQKSIDVLSFFLFCVYVPT